MRRSALVAPMGSIWAHPCQTGNNSRVLSNIRQLQGHRILNISAQRRITWGMKQMSLSVMAALMVSLALPADAAGCYADYKAKQDNPLRLHYGVAQINGACDADAARAELGARLATQGWELLNVLSVFGDEGLAQRKDSAGSNYLRF